MTILVVIYDSPSSGPWSGLKGVGTDSALVCFTLGRRHLARGRRRERDLWGFQQVAGDKKSARWAENLFFFFRGVLSITYANYTLTSDP